MNCYTSSSRCLLVVCFMVMVLLFGCNSSNTTSDILSSNQTIPPFEPPNVPPVIDCINCSDHCVCPGGSVQLCVVAHDANHDELTYTFYSSNGIISSNSETASWQLPHVEDTYTLYVVVSDGYYKVIGSVEVEVNEHPVQDRIT